MPRARNQKVAMTLTKLPKHKTLVDPFTGDPLEAIGFKRNGSPIWPVLGGSQPVVDPAAPPADPAPTPTPAPKPGPPAPAPAPAVDPALPDPKAYDALGDAGKRAVAAEREARAAADESRKATEKTNADLTAQLAQLEPLQKLAKALGGGEAAAGKTEVELLSERLAAQEKAITEQRDEAAKERLLRIRLEVAQEKGLTKAQAARLTGTTAEELAADADELLSLFPAPVVVTPPAVDPKAPAPKPDPSQGARGEAPTRSTSLAAAIGAEMAQKTG